MLVLKHRNALEHGLAVVEDVYGRFCYVKPAELDRARERGTLCPLYASTGRRLSDLPKNFQPEGGVMLNLNNIASVTFPAILAAYERMVKKAQ